MPVGRAVHVLVFDGFADWEPAIALAELRSDSGRRVVSVSFGETTRVRSMGGLVVVADCALQQVDAAGVELLILPGGAAWQEGDYPADDLERLARRVLDAERPVAAVCGATLALARVGLLDARRHTSNSLRFLTDNAPAYRGRERYVEAPAVRDEHVITANGFGYVELTREIYLELGLAAAADLDPWVAAHKSGMDPFEER